MTHEERRERRKQLSAAVAGGMSVPQAAREFGMGCKYAYLACIEFGGLPDGYAKIIHPSSMQILAKLLNTNESISEIARQCKLTHQRISKIYRLAIEAGIKFPHRKTKK